MSPWASPAMFGDRPRTTFQFSNAHHVYALSAGEREHAVNNLRYESLGTAGYFWRPPKNDSIFERSKEQFARVGYIDRRGSTAFRNQDGRGVGTR